MTRFLTAIAAMVFVATACVNPTGPTLQGQWAARGIELSAQPASTELRFACGEAVRVGRGLVVGDSGTMRFSARGESFGNSFTVDFVGYLQNDSIITATVTVHWPQAAPSVQTHVLLAGGDPAFQSYYCVDGA